LQALLGFNFSYFFVLCPCAKINILYNRSFRQEKGKKTALKHLARQRLKEKVKINVIPIVLNQG
jgi:hypothetical protein